MFQKPSNTTSRSLPVVTVAPISKKLGAGSTAKSGTGIVAKSPSGKSSNPYTSTAKSSTFATSGKSSNTFGSSTAKSSTSNAFGTSGKSSSNNTFGISGKSNNVFGSGSKSESGSPPILIGGKRSTAFTTSPSKSYPSTSFSTPKRPSTSFGILWIPGRRRHKKKEYVHIPHNYEGSKGRSPSMYPFENMSGDSSSHQPFKKKEEESNLLLLERPKGPIATAASAGAVVATVEAPQESTDSPDIKHEKQEFKEETKEAAGDATFSKEDKSYLENESVSSHSCKSPESKWDKDKGDKVDSVYLRPPPPHKVRSNTSSTDDEDCGIKCLYYTLQCCDCVLM